MSAIIEGIIILVVGLVCAAVVIMLIEVAIVKDERLGRHHTCEEKGGVPLVYDGNFLCVKPESLVPVE